MKKRIASIILVIILALIPCLPALAEGNSTVTITMATDKDIDIILEPILWNIGDVEPNTEYVTDPYAKWCTITNEGNCVVDIRIKGEDAVWVDNPSAYTWQLSSDNTTAKRKYALLYHIAQDDADSYTPITTIDTQMKHVKKGYEINGKPLTLIGHDDKAYFGLKLLTPNPDFAVDGGGYFYASGGGRKMETTITISAVAA